MRHLLYRDIFLMLKAVPKCHGRHKYEYPQVCPFIANINKTFFFLSFNIKKK